MKKIGEIAERIQQLVLDDPGNRLEGEIRYFDEPLVGVAAADDPLFLELEDEAVVGSMHRLPADWLAGAKSVVSYFLPVSAVVRRSNYEPGVSEQWLHARFRGEEFNNSIRRFLSGLLEDWGGEAVAPLLEDGYAIDNENHRSNWSERHIAYIAGLGTFGLNRGLITARGMAGRFGSVVTSLELLPSRRSYTELYQYCPGMTGGSCDACIARCPAGAITGEGKTKSLCGSYLLLDRQAGVIRETFGYPYKACGKCQTDVPCEERIPIRGAGHME